MDLSVTSSNGAQTGTTATIHDEGSHYILISVLKKKPIPNTNHPSSLTKVVFVSHVAPQKLKAACHLIAAPNSSAKLVGLWSNTENDKTGTYGSA